MVARQKVSKHPNESNTYYADFANMLVSGETLASVTSVVAEPSDAITIGANEISGTKVNVRISAGTVLNSPYWVTFTVVTSAGNTLVLQGRLVVMTALSQ